MFFRNVNVDERGYVDYPGELAFRTVSSTFHTAQHFRAVTYLERLHPVFTSGEIIRITLVPESAPDLPTRRRSSIGGLFSRSGSGQTEHGAKYIEVKFTSHDGWRPLLTSDALLLLDRRL